MSLHRVSVSNRNLLHNDFFLFSFRSLSYGHFEWPYQFHGLLTDISKHKYLWYFSNAHKNCTRFIQWIVDAGGQNYRIVWHDWLFTNKKLHPIHSCVFFLAFLSNIKTRKFTKPKKNKSKYLCRHGCMDAVSCKHEKPFCLGRFNAWCFELVS